jgi:hypothetical protein
MLPGESRTYTSQDSIQDKESADAALYAPDYLNSLAPKGLPPHSLELKVGQPIMLIRNKNTSRGQCNGSRLIVQRLGRKLIFARVMTGVHAGEEVMISRVPLTSSDEDRASPVKFTRRQFPIKPAYAMTINKSQGQTLNHVGLYLPQPVFGHGQIYVALSRCTNPQNLKILIDNGNIPGKTGTYTRNVVYKRVLSNFTE